MDKLGEYVDFEEIESSDPKPIVDEVIHEVEVEEIPPTQNLFNPKIDIWSQFVGIFDHPKSRGYRKMNF